VVVLQRKERTSVCFKFTSGGETSYGFDVKGSLTIPLSTLEGGCDTLKGGGETDTDVVTEETEGGTGTLFILTHTTWSGHRGYLRRGDLKEDEGFVSGTEG
jgi:hypothetical protein